MDCDGLLLEEAVVVVEVVEVMVMVLAMLVMLEVEEVVVEEEGVGPERRKQSVGEVERTPAEEVAGLAEGE